MVGSRRARSWDEAWKRTRDRKRILLPGSCSVSRCLADGQASGRGHAIRRERRLTRCSAKLWLVMRGRAPQSPPPLRFW